MTVYSVPKPERRPKKQPRQPQRSPLPRATKPVPKINARRQAKRLKGYREFMASAVWRRIRKAALERAGNRCEQTSFGPDATSLNGFGFFHCPNTTRLTVHHKTYARFGGNELPDDLFVLCKGCHDRLEASKPNKKNRSRLWNLVADGGGA